MAPMTIDHMAEHQTWTQPTYLVTVSDSRSRCSKLEAGFGGGVDRNVVAWDTRVFSVILRVSITAINMHNPRPDGWKMSPICSGSGPSFEDVVDGE